ncbi:MutS-related protein [Mucilaginibacter ginsenosidivorax]|uniref:DNA mismatch repair protein n=1 Tax=Mucilaginibacter ginsenosidivorax TaxID=862126 RepID=A0A5B8W605_9SPHI|nr:DNA mismatch repair protein [Mucilaginibacter ginsenosidivorax]QEC78877.1 DNA mismatch repair protein [Mucilaginibacter ginsenosidivorax]
MSFTTDKQTLDDLNLIGKRGSDSVYNIFNHTRTQGGAELMESMFLLPLSDPNAIDRRIGAIRFFRTVGIDFPFQSESLAVLEQYMADTDERSKLSAVHDTLVRKLSAIIAGDEAYRKIAGGIKALIQTLRALQALVSGLPKRTLPPAIREAIATISGLLNDPSLVSLLTENAGPKLSFEKAAALDQLVRFQHHEKIRQILKQIYWLDVCITVAKVARERNLTFPLPLPQGQHVLRLENVWHPQVKQAVPNTLHMMPGSNIIFLTGANMAGKSTFMKSLGIALYLAHIGFPVAAERMEFSVCDGLFTTINLPDDLGSGNSHFYAEVLRVKKIARELAQGKNLFIILDELFRGTNVTDACEGTIVLTEAFAGKSNCMFVVSTHIIEAGDVLKDRCDNIEFLYLPTHMEGNTPVYSYKLENGITSDRHGMVIINNERILEIIRSRKFKQPGA